jgi:hypothetical protein
VHVLVDRHRPHASAPTACPAGRFVASEPAGALRHRPTATMPGPGRGAAHCRAPRRRGGQGIAPSAPSGSMLARVDNAMDPAIRA